MKTLLLILLLVPMMSFGQVMSADYDLMIFRGNKIADITSENFKVNSSMGITSSDEFDLTSEYSIIYTFIPLGETTTVRLSQDEFKRYDFSDPTKSAGLLMQRSSKHRLNSIVCMLAGGLVSGLGVSLENKVSTSSSLGFTIAGGGFFIAGITNSIMSILLNRDAGIKLAGHKGTGLKL